MNDWVIESRLWRIQYNHSQRCAKSEALRSGQCICDNPWSTVSEVFFKRDDDDAVRKLMNPRTLEECVAQLHFHRDFLRSKDILKIARYRIHNLATDEAIPMEALGL